MNKNIIIGAVAILAIVLVIVGFCIFNGNKSEKAVEVEVNAEKQVLSKEEIVKSSVEQYLKSNYEGIIEEVVFTKVKVYTEEEVKNDERLKEYNLTPDDMVFEVGYEFRVNEGFDNMIQFTAGSGVEDGKWIKEKYNVGFLMYSGSKNYSVTNFGTGF